MSPLLPPPAHVQPAFAELTSATRPARTQRAWSEHVVRAGDSLYELALRHHTTVGALVTRNHLGSAAAILRVGQRLQVPRAAGSLPRPAPSARQDGTHVVRPGDTLGGIARRHRVSLAALTAANRLTTGSILRVGQRLTVPGGQAKARSAVKARRAKAATAATQVVVVRAGDSPARIARRYGVSVISILKANGLTPTTPIHVGQRLRIVGATTRQPGVGTSGVTPNGSRLGPAAWATYRALLARPAPSRAQIRALIVSTARRHGVDPRLALAIGWQESGWNQRAVSHAHAIGVMQCLPSTGQWISGLVGRRLDLLDAGDNITCGVALLRALGRAADSERQAVAGYYQGLSSVRAKGMYSDTKAYVASVLAHKARM